VDAAKIHARKIRAYGKSQNDADSNGRTKVGRGQDGYSSIDELERLYGPPNGR